MKLSDGSQEKNNKNETSMNKIGVYRMIFRLFVARDRYVYTTYRVTPHAGV